MGIGWGNFHMDLSSGQMFFNKKVKSLCVLGFFFSTAHSGETKQRKKKRLKEVCFRPQDKSSCRASDLLNK